MIQRKKHLQRQIMEGDAEIVRLREDLKFLKTNLLVSENKLSKTKEELRNLELEYSQAKEALQQIQLESQIVKVQLNEALNDRSRRIHPFVQEALKMVSSQLPTRQELEIPVYTSESLFTKYGSDKDTRHSYGPFYLNFLRNSESPRILEIGVGSTNNYPYSGLPAGCSLRALREYRPQALLIGVDIDPESISILKSESFVGFVADQTSDSSLSELVYKLRDFSPFDLIIDDGFHDPHANLKTFLHLFPLLSQTGKYVIEDVHETLIDFCRVISSCLPAEIEILDLRREREGVDDNILLIFSKK